MKELKFDKSAIPQEFTYNLMEHHDYIWAAVRTPGLYRIMFFTIAEILKHYKSKTTPRVGFILKDLNGQFKFGAVLNYHAPEEDTEDDDKGNYTLEFTLNEADMGDCDIVVDNHSDLFITCVTRHASEILNARFTKMEYCNTIFCEAIDTLVKFLDANASEAEEVSVVYDDVFTATVSVEGGKKMISIVPGSMIKQYIKGDASL